MITYIKKRDGKVTDFNERKISNAILGAMKEVWGKEIKASTQANRAASIAKDIANAMEESVVEVEKIQDLVEDKLMKKFPEVAKAYIKYRQERTRIREMNSDINKHIKEALSCSNVQNSNANLDEYSFGGRKNEASNIIQKELALRDFISPDVADAHRNNDLYIHDLSEYTVGMSNCMFIDFGRLLRCGFGTRNGDVRPANTFATACQLVAVIAQCTSQTIFGGVASSSLDHELAPYVRKSFLKHYKKGLKYADRRKSKTWKDFDILYNRVSKTASIIAKGNIFKNYSNAAYEYAIDLLEEEGLQATQALYHNLNTLESRA